MVPERIGRALTRRYARGVSVTPCNVSSSKYCRRMELRLRVLRRIVTFPHDDTPNQEKDAECQEEVDPSWGIGKQGADGPQDEHGNRRDDSKIHSELTSRSSAGTFPVTLRT